MQKLSDITGHPLQIFLLMHDEELIASFKALWPEDKISWTVFSDGQSILEKTFSEPPDLIIAQHVSSSLNSIELLRTLKDEHVYRRICGVLMVMNTDYASLSHLDERIIADGLITLPACDDELRVRVELAVRRITSNMDANPLTRLPGNTSIINVTQRLLSSGTDFALAYVDMDNFKPYNDKYGFSRGDEMLLMAARLIANTVREQQCEPSFVGHIGGDDFVFILPRDIIEDACKRLISTFDVIVPGFYDPADRERGSILSFDRRGNELLFPILSISIAVVFNGNGKYTHYAQLSHVAGQLKKIAKAIPGSNYVIDRRR